MSDVRQRARFLTRRAVLTLTACAAISGISTLAAVAGEARIEAETFLRGRQFTSEDLAALESGEVIARSETSKGDAEMAALAAVKIHASLDHVARYYAEMVKYVDGKVTLGFGRFSTPPEPADVAELQLPPGEVDDLRTCRVGECELRLGGVTLGSLRSAIDWSAPDYADQVNDLVRQSAVRYVAAYLERGDDALVSYDDRDQPTSLKQQWLEILANSPSFHEYRPELAAYLEKFPHASLEGAQDIVYWVKENYGPLKTVISIVHAVVYRPPDRPDMMLVAQKQIYASHYYDASLAVATILAADENGSPVSYLLYGNRSRGSMLRGGFGGLKRTAARDQAKKAAKQTLGTIQQVLERHAGTG